MQSGKEVQHQRENNPATWKLMNCGQEARQTQGPGFIGEVDAIFEAHVEKFHPRELRAPGDSAF